MKTSLTVRAALFALSVGLPASAAKADTLLFTLTGFDNASWEQSSNPTPIEFNDGLYTQIAVTDGTGTFPLAEDPGEAFSQGVGYQHAGVSSVFAVVGGLEVSYGTDAAGPQIYTGPESAPIFAATAPGHPIVLDAYGRVDDLTITDLSAVPEPATWTMMLAGVGGLGLAMRSRRRQIASA